MPVRGQDHRRGEFIPARTSTGDGDTSSPLSIECGAASGNPYYSGLPNDHFDGLRATIVGHASVLIQAGGLNVLTDPVGSGRPGVRVAAGDWWDRIEIGKGGEVTIVPAYHWSSRTGRDRRMALWCGFMLITGGGRAYFAGDTAYGNGGRSRHSIVDVLTLGGPLVTLTIGLTAH